MINNKAQLKGIGVNSGVLKKLKCYHRAYFSVKICISRWIHHHKEISEPSYHHIHI